MERIWVWLFHTGLSVIDLLAGSDFVVLGSVYLYLLLAFGGALVCMSIVCVSPFGDDIAQVIHDLMSLQELG